MIAETTLSMCRWPLREAASMAAPSTSSMVSKSQGKFACGAVECQRLSARCGNSSGCIGASWCLFLCTTLARPCTSRHPNVFCEARDLVVNGAGLAQHLVRKCHTCSGHGGPAAVLSRGFCNPRGGARLSARETPLSGKTGAPPGSGALCDP